MVKKPVRFTEADLEKGDYDMDRLREHDEECDKWLDLLFPCTCSVRYRDMEDYYGEPPIRRSKSARPKHIESGRGLKHILRIVKERGKK